MKPTLRCIEHRQNKDRGHLGVGPLPKDTLSHPHRPATPVRELGASGQQSRGAETAPMGAYLSPPAPTAGTIESMSAAHPGDPPTGPTRLSSTRRAGSEAESHQLPRMWSACHDKGELVAWGVRGGDTARRVICVGCTGVARGESIGKMRIWPNRRFSAPAGRWVTSAPSSRIPSVHF